MQSRPAKCIILALRKEMPDQDGDFARCRDSGDLLTSACFDAQEEGAQRPWYFGRSPSRLDEEPPCKGAALF